MVLGNRPGIAVYVNHTKSYGRDKIARPAY